MIETITKILWTDVSCHNAMRTFFLNAFLTPGILVFGLINLSLFDDSRLASVGEFIFKMCLIIGPITWIGLPFLAFGLFDICHR